MQFGGPQNVDSGEDDMLFCIPLQPSSSGLQFVAVRRLATGLPRQIAYGGPLYRSTDWRLSVHLNIVMHSQFRLSIKALRCAIATSPRPWAPLGVPHLVCPTQTQTGCCSDLTAKTGCHDRVWLAVRMACHKGCRAAVI
jgi:hypothetical protein